LVICPPRNARNGTVDTMLTKPVHQTVWPQLTHAFVSFLVFGFDLLQVCERVSGGVWFILLRAPITHTYTFKYTHTHTHIYTHTYPCTHIHTDTPSICPGTLRQSNVLKFNRDYRLTRKLALVIKGFLPVVALVGVLLAWQGGA
jgi:hypothetical protein